MSMTEYLKSARMTEDERSAWVEKYGTPEQSEVFSGLDMYDGASHHAEYGAAAH